jgi:hypothetical protein
VGVDGLLNLFRGVGSGLRRLALRLMGRGEPPPAI